MAGMLSMTMTESSPTLYLTAASSSSSSSSASTTRLAQASSLSSLSLSQLQEATRTTTTTLEQCLLQLPGWVHRGPDHFRQAMWDASNGKTDKVGNPKGRNDRHSHNYQLMYWPYLSKLITRKQCLQEQSSLSTTPLRFLEIGLGCNPQRVGVGGSALAWHALFQQLQHPPVELYVFEYDQGCARQWEQENPGIVTKLFTGDASSQQDLKRAMLESGNRPFDVIIDDGSHINDHQVMGIEYLFQDWIAPGGLYIIEDIESACFDWPANVGKPERGPGTGGTRDCLVQANGKPTILGKLIEYQKQLMHWKKGKAPFGHTVTHVDIHWGAAVVEKRLDVVP